MSSSSSFVQGVGFVKSLLSKDRKLRGLVTPCTCVRTPKTDKNDPTFDSLSFEGPEYYFKDGFRMVHPYFSVLSFTISKRLFKSAGKINSVPTLENALRLHLPFVSMDFLDFKCKMGLLNLNFEKTKLEDPIKTGDFISNLIHVHERPILDTPLKIIYENSDLVVVNKPSSWCIYPTSTYRFNTLLFILAKDFGYRNLRPVHRLDKKTSGVIIFGKNPEIVSKLSNSGFSKTVSKTYIALVDGNFPPFLTCNDSISDFFIHSSVKKFLGSAKPALTEFKLIKSFGDFSLIEAVPITGRTHQIRIHLKNLGYPIVNDSTYNYRDKYDIIDKEDQDYLKELKKLRTDYGINEKSYNTLPQDQVIWNLFSTCLDCRLGETYRAKVYPYKSMFICLHSWKYQIGKEFKFEAPWPKWALNPELIRKTVLDYRKT